MPALESIYEVRQTDGSSIQVINRGDEWRNWTETPQGHTIAQAADGNWYYVKGYQGDNPVLTEQLANGPVPNDLSENIIPPIDAHLGEELVSAQEEITSQLGESYSGKILFVLAEFSDFSGTTSEASWAAMLSDKVSDYYSKASFGKIQTLPAEESYGILNNGVVGWVNLGYPHPNTRNNTDGRNIQLTKDAILAANTFVDYASFDTDGNGVLDPTELAIVVIVAGYDRATTFTQPSVWGHKRTIGSPSALDGVTISEYAQFGELHRDGNQATMGIVVHELGHLLFGLPDLYDKDGSSAGIGHYCVMSSGSWGKSLQDRYPGETPTMPSAWVQYQLGWVDAQVNIGNVSLNASGATSANSDNSVVKIPTDKASEYFLIQNRQALGYDRGLETKLDNADFGGLIIWHIDSSQTDNRDDFNRLVDIEEADGSSVARWAVGNKKDFWYFGNAAIFNDETTPDSDFNDGSTSNINIYNISISDEIMNLEWNKGGNPYIVNPDNNSILKSTAQEFTWTIGNPEAQNFRLEFGSSLGSNDIYDSGELGTITGIPLESLPFDGSQLYVRFWYQADGNWFYQDYNYTTVTMNGECGKSHAMSFFSKPSKSLCNFGIATDVTGIGPWSWSCLGIDEGQTSSCFANIRQAIASPSNGAGGTISPNVPQSVYQGETVEFIITADLGYQLNTVGGTCRGTLDGDTYTVIMQTDCTVEAKFLEIEPTVIAGYQVVGGLYHTCIIDDNGLVCGGIGNPSQIPTMSYPARISAGEYHSCAIDYTKVVCWGENEYGQATAPELSNPTQVSAGRFHTCAIDDSGVVCWGRDRHGRTSVPPLSNPSRVAAGGAHTCAIDNTGVVCWGYNKHGRTLPPTLINPIQITSGYQHSCALDDTGVVCWGNNEHGLLDVPYLSNPIQLQSGEQFNCALDDTGVVCWGLNSSGQTDVPVLLNPTEVATGYRHACAFDDTGLVCWGYSGGLPTNLSFDGIEDVDGVCGASSGKSFDTQPSENLCLIGTANAMQGSGPWSWSCMGEGSGRIAYCSADILTIPECSANPVLIDNTQHNGSYNLLSEISIDTNLSVIVKNNSAVIYKAPKITLKPGFVAETGSQFQASSELVNCNESALFFSDR